MSVTIRVDDYPGTKPAEFYRHNRASFEKFDNVMQECTGGKKYLLGVIPGHTSDEDLEWLGTRNIVVGCHGTDHRESHQNQFDDYMTAADVEALVMTCRKRLQHLTGQPVDVYMPPHNVIDDKTLRACIEAGFSAFTSGPETKSMVTSMFVGDSIGTVKQLRQLHSGLCGVSYREGVPNGYLDYGRSDELLLRGAVEHLSTRRHLTCLTLHWTWEANLDNDFSTLRELLSSIKEHVVDFTLASHR